MLTFPFIVANAAQVVVQPWWPNKDLLSGANFSRIVFRPNFCKIGHLFRLGNALVPRHYPNQSSEFSISISMASLGLSELTYLGLALQICIVKNSFHFPSDACIHHDYTSISALTWGGDQKNSTAPRGVNSLSPRDTLWQHRSESTLAQVMACCLTAPSHSLNQCWFLISEDLWHSPESNFTTSAQVTILWIIFFKLLTHHPGANELTHCGLATPYGDRELGQHWLR